jgi:hypothetical protein
MSRLTVAGIVVAGLLVIAAAALDRQPEKESATMTTAELMARDWIPVAPVDKAAPAAYRTATFALG